MKPQLIVLLAVALLTSCEIKDEPPIAPDKMQAVLTDLHYAEAYSMMVNDSLHQAQNKNNDSLAMYYNDILSHHKMDKDLLMKSVEWYKQHPEILDSVYARMLPELTTLESITP